MIWAPTQREVLSKEEDGGTALKDQYNRFILRNASIGGRFVPHWSKCSAGARLSQSQKLAMTELTLSEVVKSTVWGRMRIWMSPESKERASIEEAEKRHTDSAEV